MTDHDCRQPDLFPDGNGGHQRQRRSISPGDWLSIEHDGRTIVGMIYRCQSEAYRFAYWDGGLLRFGAATRGQIGAWHEELTTQFRGQIAVVPDYVERCITDWMMRPEDRIKAREAAKPQNLSRSDPPKVQRRLFPE